ncbi:TOMM precursor leader peptide-binding protein [Nocardia stercoris]|uniref:TOMM leader peptide-binding protein n=1 Tax=Nocardia stercoris TaxID=2483361 RepID=A0A3M2LKA3_9NOCA|nr:TOMM precursor leader peptide-binding protein [Nocardia stercoris]RMI35198.1 hypothetical protein EBN03_02570 [Nocardia stercoris]
MSNFRLRGPMVHPRVPVLRRPSGAVQLGWDPERAVLVEPPGLDADTVANFLRLLDGMHSHPQILWQAAEFGVPPDRTLELLAELGAAGLLLAATDRPVRVDAVHIHGRGPLSDALADGTRRLGLRPGRSRDYPLTASASSWSADLVILADALVPDPRLTGDLVLHRIPHLVVRLRDGRGVVGPLVLPGATSCLRCADLTRGDRDAEWPHLAAQLLGRIGHGSPAAVAATAALALRELETIREADAARPPESLDTTLELDPQTMTIERRAWVAHPDCGCRGETGAR